MKILIVTLNVTIALFLEARVNRWGEFSLIGWLFAVGSLLKIINVVQSVVLLFPWYKLCINFDKK
jgi:hypothetical protein